MSTHRRCALCILLASSALLLQCKPVDEEPRDPARTAATRPPLVATSSDGTVGTIRLVAPERATASDANRAATGRTAPNDGEEPSAHGAVREVEPEVLARAKSLGVDEALLAAVAATASPQAQKDAAQANRRGLKRHRNLDLKAAIEAYEAGLNAWPGHLFSRYNLACAQALAGDQNAALRHLAVLSAGEIPQAADRLRAARVDPDLESLRRNDVFRALTRYASVEVSWSPSLPDSQAAVALVDRLRREDIPAHEGREWRKDLPETTLYVAIDHSIAQSVGDEIIAANATPANRIDSRFLNDNRPIVLVIGSGETSGAPTDPGTTSLDTMIGERMTSKHDGIEEEFLLKPTGFFVWNVRTADGMRVEKTGRYSLKGQALHLDFQMTSTRPGHPPEVTVEQGRRENHVLTITGGALLIGSTRFTR
jgi:hypothetical protein